MRGKRRVALATCACATCAVMLLAACSPQLASTGAQEEGNADDGKVYVDGKIGSKIGYESDGRLIDHIDQLPQIYSHAEEEERNAELNQPSTYTDRNGFEIQPVPADPKGYNMTWLDGEQRGCLSCHETLEDAQMNQPTYHRLIIMGYPVEQGVQNCLMCHDTWQPNANKLKDNIHQTHMNNELFDDMGGNCMSCHHINDDGDFVLWDVAKYDLYKGYNLVDAEESGATLSYDQDTITPLENQFYKTIKSEPSEWTNDDTNIDPSVYENWTISIEGDVANPITMTLPELKEKFGTKTAVLKNHCNANGTGQGTIYQAEVTGIPLKDVIEFCQPTDGANGYTPKGYDGFGNLMPMEYLDENALIVLEVNGETLRPSQGYPAAIWVGGGAAGAEFPKYVSSITISTEDDADKLWTHPRHGTNVKPSVTPDPKVVFYPNAGVLNYPTNVVLNDQVGKEITFEGYADAYTEPITRVEYSLDGGKTWLTMETPNTDVDRWVYWRMNFTPQEAGSYHLKIRAFSQAADGTEHAPTYTTDYQFTVR